MIDEYVNIDWTYSGDPDPFLGTNASDGEKALSYTAATIITTLVAVLDYISPHPVANTWWRLATLILLAYDTAGGTVANSLNSYKRFYHTFAQADDGFIGRFLKIPHVYTLLQVHPLIISWVFRTPIERAVLWYLALQIAVVAVLGVPLHLRRPMAVAVSVTAILIHGGLVPLAKFGWDWFVPCLFIKVVIAHIVQEEPYRPLL